MPTTMDISILFLYSTTAHTHRHPPPIPVDSEHFVFLHLFLSFIHPPNHGQRGVFNNALPFFLCFPQFSTFCYFFRVSCFFFCCTLTLSFNHKFFFRGSTFIELQFFFSLWYCIFSIHPSIQAAIQPAQDEYLIDEFTLRVNDIQSFRK